MPGREVGKLALRPEKSLYLSPGKEAVIMQEEQNPSDYAIFHYDISSHRSRRLPTPEASA